MAETAKENSRKKYLTTEKFQEFKDNDFSHLLQDVARIRGKLWVLVPVSCATLATVVAFLIFMGG